MQIRIAVTVFAGALLVVGCDLAPDDALDSASLAHDESVGQETQELISCNADCDCELGYECLNGSCTHDFRGGPQPPLGYCHGDCQCPNGYYCGAQDVCRNTVELRYTNICGDTGVAHPSPDSLVGMAIVGPPGATVRKFNRHVSCGAAAQWWEDTSFNAVIGPSGWISINYPTPAPFTCDSEILGRWESYVIAGGMVSNSAYVTYRNSGCDGALEQCSTAQSYCPPSGPCNGLGCP